MKKIKWGLIGCGDIVNKRVASALSILDSCELVGVCRAQSDLVADCVQKYGVRKGYKSYHELINDNEIEAVYIATPHNLHAIQTITCAKSGKHVLCEKPMAINAKECDVMIETCMTYNVKLGVAFYRHFYPAIKRIKEIISSGEIGKISLVQINAFEWLGRNPGESRYWLLEKDKSGGGPMIDFGCHRIEVLLNIFGSIDKVISHYANLLFDIEVEDTATAILQFKKKIMGILTVTRAVYEQKDTLDIYGTKGSIHVPVLNNGIFKIITNAEERFEEHPPPKNPHITLIEAFNNSIIYNHPLEVNGYLGREVTAIEDQIYVVQR